jgi:AraC family transcriptional regulator of adaptative response / DNA-3-methyladenine glycosylase II
MVRHLTFEAPLDARALLEFFGRRAVPGLEEWDGEVYRRSLRGLGVVEIRALSERVAVRMHLARARDEAAAVARVRAMLDLDADPLAINEALSGDPLMRRLVRKAPGRRVPGCASGDEIAIRAVLGQQVSLAGAATLAGRLVAEYGESLRHPTGGVTHEWPDPEALAEASRSHLSTLGASPGSRNAQSSSGDRAAWRMPVSRIRAICGLSSAIGGGELSLEPGADRRATEDRLLALPGIGPWTASYIAMRALRDPDAFLSSDLGVRHALDRLGLESRPAAAEALSQAWRPYRAYALQHLWAVTS